MHKCLFKSNNKSNPLKWSKDFILFNLKTELQYLRHMSCKFGPKMFGPMCSSSRIFATFKNCINRGSHLTWMSFNAAFKCDHYRAFNYQMDRACINKNDEATILNIGIGRTLHSRRANFI